MVSSKLPDVILSLENFCGIPPQVSPANRAATYFNRDDER